MNKTYASFRWARVASKRVHIDDFIKTLQIANPRDHWDCFNLSGAAIVLLALDTFVWTRLIQDGDHAIAVRVIRFLW